LKVPTEPAIGSSPSGFVLALAATRRRFAIAVCLRSCAKSERGRGNPRGDQRLAAAIGVRELNFQFDGFHENDLVINY
jgi:hypothetical protein